MCNFKYSCISSDSLPLVPTVLVLTGEFRESQTAVVEWLPSTSGNCPPKPQVYQLSSCVCNQLRFICLGLSNKSANQSPPSAIGKADWTSDSATLGHGQLYFLEAFGSARRQLYFHSWGKPNAAGMSSKHPTMLRTQPPTAKMAPALPVPNVRNVPAAEEIVTDKHRDGEPCFWHVEGAGVQWENMSLQSPLPFPFAWGLERKLSVIQLDGFTWIILNWVLAFCSMLLIQQVI